MVTKEEALRGARTALLTVQDAAGFRGHISLDGRPVTTWTIGPREDVEGGLLDAVRKASAACDEALGARQ